jgi:hypothetical protein
MGELKKWPDPATWHPSACPDKEAAYQGARADFWEERCRVAVEALHRIADHCTKQEDWRFDSIEDGADVTLARIGPLPEQGK